MKIKYTSVMRMKRARLNNHIESIEQKFNTY